MRGRPGSVAAAFDTNQFDRHLAALEEFEQYLRAVVRIAIRQFRPGALPRATRGLRKGGRSSDRRETTSPRYSTRSALPPPNGTRGSAVPASSIKGRGFEGLQFAASAAGIRVISEDIAGVRSGVLAADPHSQNAAGGGTDNEYPPLVGDAVRDELFGEVADEPDVLSPSFRHSSGRRRRPIDGHDALGFQVFVDAQIAADSQTVAGLAMQDDDRRA